MSRLNRRQAERLARLGEWLHSTGRAFLFELLVPAEEEQLAAVGGDADRYDRELRPGLMVDTIRELQSSGVEPDIWKIEGLDERERLRPRRRGGAGWRTRARAVCGARAGRR